MEDVSIFHSRGKKPQFHVPERLIRTPEARLKGCRPCPHPYPYQQPCPEPLLETPDHILPGWDTQLFRAGACYVPSAWRSNKAILFYFIQNTVSKLQRGSGTRRLSFCHSPVVCTGQGPDGLFPHGGIRLSSGLLAAL